jgi:seryl-tRNA synthetase
MAKTWEQELKEVKRELQSAQTEQTKISTRLEEAKKRRQAAIDRLKAKGIDPKDLKKAIEEKERELEQTIESIRECLPGDDDEDDEDE